MRAESYSSLSRAPPVEVTKYDGATSEQAKHVDVIIVVIIIIIRGYNPSL